MLHVTLKSCPFGAPAGRAGLAVLIFASGCIAAFLGEARIASAHGVVGLRFFPATLSTDDPFVADELSLPTVSHIKRPAEGERPPTRETEVIGEFSKRLSP